MADAEVELGVVGKPHGVRGAVKVYLHNAQSDFLYDSEWVDAVSPAAGARERWTVEEVRSTRGHSCVLTVAELKGRDQAETRRGWKLMVRKDALPAAEADEFYYHEIPGWQVRTESGRVVGTVRRALDSEVDVLEVRLVGGGELLLPVVGDFVIRIDRDKEQIIVVEALERLFEDVL